MYEIFLKLLNEKGVTAYKVGKATGIAGSTFTDWKSGRSVPKQEKLQKIADYFGVSLDYLMTGKDSRLSAEDALLDVQISEDIELKEALKKYYSLSDKKKKHVLELIDLLSEE